MDTSCGDWATALVDEHFSPIYGGIKLIESLSDSSNGWVNAKCKDKLGDLNFESLYGWMNDELDFDKLIADVATMTGDDSHKSSMNNCTHKGYLRLLPATCSLATLKAGKGCAFQISLTDVVGTEGFNLAVAMSLCPKSMLPYVSIRVSGPGATKLFAPCSQDSHCGKGQKCQDILAGDEGMPATTWTDAGKDFAELIFSGKAFDVPMGWDKVKDRVNKLVAKHGIGTEVMRIVRSYYDSSQLTLGSNQVMPICVPKGKLLTWNGSTGIEFNDVGDVKLQSPVTSNPILAWTIKGVEYKCDKSESIESENIQWKKQDSRTDVKCVSAKLEKVAPLVNLFTSKTTAQGKCTVTTLVDVIGLLKPWETKGTDVFADKYLHGPSVANSKDNQWFQRDCDGAIVGSLAKNIYAAVKVPALNHIMDTFTELVRTIASEEAKTVDQACLTDDQIMSYYMPWTLDFWLNLATSWGPDKKTPALLPKSSSVGEALAKKMFTDDGSLNGIRVATPATCTLAGYPEKGCGLSYDLSWLANKEKIAMDVHIKKCARNPIGLADVSVLCSSQDGNDKGLCGYGRNWCSTSDNKCQSKKDKCYHLGSEELLDTLQAVGIVADNATELPQDLRFMDPKYRQQNQYSEDADPISFWLGQKDGKNEKVKAGDLKLDAINLIRSLFGDKAISNASDVGYCAPNLDALADSVDDTDKLLEQRLVMNKDTGTVGIAGLNKATVSSAMGKSSLKNAVWLSKKPNYRVPIMHFPPPCKIHAVYVYNICLTGREVYSVNAGRKRNAAW